MALRVGIAGISGYTGVLLYRMIMEHPELTLTWVGAGRASGEPLSKSWPGIPGGDRLVQAVDPDAIAESCDAVFLALPHGVSGAVGRDCFARGVRVFDLGADFRLRDPAVYAAAYGLAHPAPGLLAEAVYGLPEKDPAALAGARLVAVPGCYPTATGLAALPLVENGLADWLIADCLSGISGAGRSPSARNLYCEVSESAEAYGVGGAHRHTPEIEQLLGVPVTFTPHLVPMRRGMLATVHARPRVLPSAAALRALFVDRYANAPLVEIVDAPPATREVRGTGRCRIFPTVDTARGVVSVFSAIDNLGKGASTQAMQCLNLSFGLPETRGIPLFPDAP